MPHTPGGDPVELASTTWTRVVAPPVSTRQRAVVSMVYFNRDNIDHRPELRLLKGATPTVLGPAPLVGPGLKHQLIEGLIALDDTDEELQMRTQEVTVLTESLVTPGYMEKTP